MSDPEPAAAASCQGPPRGWCLSSAATAAALLVTLAHVAVALHQLASSVRPAAGHGCVLSPRQPRRLQGTIPS